MRTTLCWYQVALDHAHQIENTFFSLYLLHDGLKLNVNWQRNPFWDVSHTGIAC